MPGSVLLLLSLLVLLSTGSDARRIRKRGLNHKVGLLTLHLTFCMSVWFFVSLSILWPFGEYPAKWK